MKCSNCEFVIYLLPEFQFCPRCGFRLEHGQDIPPKEQKIASAVTSEHPKGDGTGGKYDTGTSEEQVRGEGQNEQPLFRDREVDQTLSSQQTHCTLHQGQPDSRGGIPMKNQPIKRDTESLEGNHHSEGAPPTPQVVAVATDGNSPYQVSAIVPCGADLLGSTDKPGETTTQNERQSKFAEKVGFDEGSTGWDDSQNADSAELGQSGFDPYQTGREDRASNRKKEMVDVNPSDNALLTHANQLQKGEEKRGDEADPAEKTGKENICIPPSEPPSSSQLVEANSQEPNSHPVSDKTTQNSSGNNSPQAQGKEEDQTPIQTSQSLKEEAQNFRGKNVEPATKVKLSAGDSDPLSVSVGVKDDDKDLEEREEKDTQTPGTSLQSSESGNPPLNSGNVHTSALIQSPMEGDETSLRDPPNGSEEVGLPSGYWYQKDETEFQTNALVPERKGQGGKGRRTTQPPLSSPLPKCSLMQVQPENGVTVVFHVFLVSNLKMEEERLHIRASGNDLGDFEINCVDMELLSSEKGRDRKKLMRFIGRCTLGIDRAYNGTHYKYAIIKNGEVVWEELIEFQRYREAIVDRYLNIPDRYVVPGATWHQYDGVSYIYEESLWEKFKGFFRSDDEAAYYRATALLAFLPKWKGFVVDNTGQEMNATSAIWEADHVVHCMTNIFIKSSHPRAQRRKPPSFNVHEVLMEYLEPKMGENFAVLAENDVAFETRISAVVSTLAMVTLFKLYQTKLPREHVLTLLRCLSLEADPTGQKCTMYEVVLDEFREELRSHAAEGIEELCNQIMTDSLVSGEETWLFAMPLLHFLRGDSQPFEQPGIEGPYHKPEWYGAQKLKLKEFQKTAANLNFLDILPRLTSSFEVDPLLKRIVLLVIPFGKLEKVVESKLFFISDVCVALITSSSRGLVSADKWNSVLQCIKVMISLLETDTVQTCVNWKTLEFTTLLCLKLVEICLKKLTLKGNLDVICQAIKLLFASICRQRREVNESLDQDKRQEIEENTISQLLMSLRTRIVSDLSHTMSSYSRSDSLRRELLVWSELLWIADENQVFLTYRQFLIDQLSGRARRLEEKYLVEIFCEMNMDEFEAAVGESFTNLAFEAMEKIINSGKTTGGDQRVFLMIANSCNQRNTRNANAGKYGELLSMLLTRSWPQEAENRKQKATQKETQKETVTSSLDPRTVQFLLTWKPMSGYLKFFGDESGRSDILLQKGQETLVLAKSLFDALVRNISDGSVTVEVLLLVHDHQKTFLELLKTTSGVERNDAERNMVKRIEEIEEFRVVKENVGTFIGMCDVISPVDLTFLKTKALQDVSSIQIQQLCERKDDNQIEITFFKLPPAVKEVLSTLRRFQKSLTFQDLWTKYGNKAQAARRNDESGKQQLSLSDVVENVWKPAFKFWNQRVACVKDGIISLEDVDELFEGYRDRREELEEELSCMFEASTEQTFTNTNELKPTVAKRVVQIQRYQQLHQHVNAADTIWKFKEAMGFTGDFKVVEDLRNQLSTEFKQKSLNSIGENFSKAGRALQCLNVDKAQCFEAVVHSKRLVEWLRSTIKSSQELKVLVDLALISAGESDMETKRITSLHTSCLGFAPLIFDLKETKDDKVGFDELIKACEPVWKTVETDRTLPKKLCDTSKHLEWLKTVKESHGSVAMTSLAQAKNINSSGVYVVGHLDTKKGPSTRQGKRLSSKNVIRLTVTLKGENEEEQTKSYSINELKDLQSKLMLIAGKAEKGKEDVELFVRNLEGVMRLATAYINLFESGYIHRMDWKQEFHCSKDLVAGEWIAKELEEESTFMESCYTNWKKKVSDARKEYKELNFFTTQQLMTLRKEIATVCHSNGLIMSNIQVLALLESVLPNLTSEQLKSAIERAFKDTEILENARGTAELPSFFHVPSQDEMVTRRSVFDNKNYLGATSSTATSVSQVQPASVKKSRPKETSKIQSFLNAATDDGYSEQIALAALASLGVDAEEDDLLLWCLEKADEADIEALYEDAKKDPMIAREVFPEEVESAELEMQAEDLRANESESDMAVEMSSTSAETITEEQEVRKDKDNEAEIGQYLTLAQLGNILRELSALGIGATARTFPAFLKRGRPNLMLVPKDEILAIVLALYMHDKKHPLPSCEEVLLCTPGTTTEEIELLWRRALGDEKGRFYCLVHADVLDFSVSKQAVDMLGLVTQGIAGKAGEHYGLVVICSSENEDRANIVAALDQYRVAAPPCPSPEDLRSYLKHQFQAPPSQYGYIGSSKITWTTAGSLDPEKLCVRVVSSHRGGLGKTLFVRRLTEQLPNLVNNDMVMTNLRRQDSNTFLHVTVPLHGNSTDSSMLVGALLPHAVKVNVPLSRIFHLDVSPSMRRGLDTLLFNLLVLGCLCDRMGRVWRKRSTDLYIVEVTTAAPLPMGFTREEEAQIQGRLSGKSTKCKRPFYDLLPTIECQTPRTVLCRFAETPDKKDFNPLFDVKEFRNAPFQRVYQYLKLSNERKSLDNFTFSPGAVDDDQRTCLMLLLRKCGIPDPSWSEIRHFVSFLNSQLRDCEHSFYCDMQLMRTVLEGPSVLNLEGFRSFVVRFMIQMSRDFATPSLTEENTIFHTNDNEELERKEIEQFQLRRRWESSPHPYLFFNQDHITMTFLGFFINSAGDLVDPQTNRTLERGLISKPLRNGLQAQRVDFATNIETSKKEDKLNQLCSVMGVNWLYDPDRAYELTTDNVKKILAIHMRFRCNIPVIVMGETGCGKTRLIRYMCGLQAGPGGPRNMLLVKVHGGTTYEDIELKVHQAEDMARANQDKNIDTVLFFDEANTTEALTMIKEVMVDRRINGRPVGQGLERLQFIAACNPYRRHTDDMIYKLESAGLGYRVKADESEDRLGHIPLRHLVYRVHALPGSMRPLIWDFGQLKPDVERLYINQIVSRFILHEGQLAGDSSTVLAVAQVLAASQTYMRDQSDECSFVSLRDVERAMQVMVWFYKHADTLGRLMRKVAAEQRREEGVDVDEDDDEEGSITPLTRALVLAIGVCYHAKLQERRKEYRTVVANSFVAPCLLPGGHKQILREILSCQKAVLNELELGPNIARNTALSENVFMMVVCIELRIPLFVVGKPGSSKSLAKTVVAHNMQGDAAKSELFKTFKQVHMASYQCSPLSTPEGIVATFRQCSKLQEGKNPDKFVSVVVLDEVGLAEDSPLMPLKTLHPLLEDGVTSADDVIETDEKPQRVAFIGISNWALDPAKMNRGIMLSRGVPSEGELIDSAMGICSSDKMVKALIQPLISSLAAGYAELYKEQKNFETLKKCGKEEFFGLRDFYSLIKMVYSIAAKQRPGWQKLEQAIKRNFGGLVEGDPVEIFKRHYTKNDEGNVKETITLRLIEASLGREHVADRTNFSENRYLLILTENYAALPIMQQHLLKTEDNAVVIFGSSFPNDQEYTQICRNINRIKVCMETGRTVILLNLESLYESLYDALNQYYERFGGEKYVDLGLGTHRVKCRVDDSFKLIVIAEKDVVYNNFPIPLINRLEKHFLVTSTSLSHEQKDLVQIMRKWASEFAKVTSERRGSRDFSIGDAFVGFHEDTIPSIVMQVCNEIERENYAPAENNPGGALVEKAREKSETMLLEMATPDAIARLPHTALAGGARGIWDAYFKEQQHSSLAAFMSHVLPSNDSHLDKRCQDGLLIQVTTHSRLLSKIDLEDICIQTKFRRSTVDFMSLQQFQTEQQFRASVRAFFEHLGGECRGILLVQCDSGDENFNLIAGARHILLEERTNASEMLNLSSLEAVHIVLIIQLPRIAGGCRNFVGFQGGKWISSHIDELRPPDRHTPSIEQLIDRPISELFGGVRIEEDDAMPAVAVAVAVAVKLLRNCVQAAACRVDSETESANRSTHRIELLLDLLPDDYQSQEESFACVVVQRTYNLLKERELIAVNPEEWLQSEALSGTGVQEWGTFRKTLLQRVFSVVVPILAEIIAFTDRDCNLDLVKKNETNWISKLWLKILADRTISELSYSDMISPGTNYVRERVQVIGSGAGGHPFSCRFPFSFIIKQRVEKLLKDASSVEAHSSATLLDSLRKLISNSQLGPPLDELRHLNSAGLQYLMDFVHMVYKHSSDVEHELVYEAILSSARELGTLEDEDGNESMDIALVHVAHERVQHRLKCFDTLVKANPDLVPRLREALQGNEPEVLLDVIALRICLEALELSQEMLLSPETRRTWCDRVLSIRPAVEDMIRKERFGPVREKCSNYGERSTVILGHCRSMWQRTGAVRLFLEHVTLYAEKDEDVNSEYVVRLWKVLGDETDFSSLRSLEAIEKFLLNYSEDVKQRTNEETASKLRRRCNAFFMELVSIFSFGDSVSKDLEQEAITLLMQYVIGHQSTQTKDFSPFPDYAIDPTPVVRSFLLQQLLRSSAKLTKLVKEHLGVFLQGAQNLKPEPSHVKEVCFLCVQCMEDILISRYQTKVADSKLTVKLKHAKNTCEEALTALSASDEESVKMSALSLDGVAKGRYVLSLVVEFLYKLFIEGDSSYKDHDAKREVTLLLEYARKLCTEVSSSTPQLYLLKQLVRRYGLDCVRTLGEYEELVWILPPEARQQEEDVIQDRFLVHGDHYRAVREGMAKTVISGKIQDTVSAITETGLQGFNKNVVLLLVMYRQITMANVLPVQTLSQKVRVKLDDFVRNGGYLSETAQPFARELLANSQGGQFQKLQIYNGKTPQEHTLAEIVIHTAVVLQCVGSGSLSQPLYALMTDPSTMNNSFLPTMPEDNYLECINAIAETMKGTNWKGEWYECGNRSCRYLYFIGECTKPMEKSTCPDCGRVLGGEQHNFLGEYTVSDRKDRTKTGHALGEPASRPTHAEPQRDMPPIVCSLLRIIMHSAMVMGASRNPQATAVLITPPCPSQSEGEFLWEHLQRDLDVLGRALGRSVDDAALTVHLVLARMISQNGGQTANAHDMRLQTRESRRCWEKDFCSEILVPVITHLDEKLQNASKLLMGDERFGKDPLVRQLYKFDEHVEDLSQGVRPMSFSLWKYRQHITVEDLSSSFQREVLPFGGEQEYKVLDAFLKQEHKLRFVQFLPDVVRLQRLLMDRFHRRIDRIDAEKYTIRQFLKDLPKGSVKEEYTNLFFSFKNAWNACKSFLGDQGRLRVPQDLCNTTMDTDCPIAMVLPSTTGMGVCSTSLTFFLVNANNESLGAYRSATNQDGPLERVSVSEVTLSHLIAYDPDRDLLPLILAHCNYSLEVGQETSVHYDWAALERQLIDRLLRGRPFVEFKEERFAFSRDTRDDTVFSSLTGKIPQESISHVVESQIINDMRSSLSDVCDVMSSLDIAIGFLASSGGQPERPLKWYLHEVLKLPKDRGLKSATAEQHCSLSHTLALWRLMALERAKIKSKNKQEPFEQLSDVFKEKLGSSEKARLNRVLRKIDIDMFLPQLLQIILLNVEKDGATISTMSFEEYLECCLANKGLEQIPGTENIPDSIKMAHLKEVWNSAVQLSDDFHRDR